MVSVMRRTLLELILTTLILITALLLLLILERLDVLLSMETPYGMLSNHSPELSLFWSVDQ
jgi:hypothetical protein